MGTCSNWVRPWPNSGLCVPAGFSSFES
uniref:Uncharacterized protein n=1 Tax=Pyricularia oryzae (strain P131) TaxID=1143193 RepID=L7J1A3_PYRO1